MEASVAVHHHAVEAEVRSLNARTAASTSAWNRASGSRTGAGRGARRPWPHRALRHGGDPGRSAPAGRHRKSVRRNRRAGGAVGSRPDRVVRAGVATAAASWGRQSRPAQGPAGRPGPDERVGTFKLGRRGVQDARPGARKPRPTGFLGSAAWSAQRSASRRCARGALVGQGIRSKGSGREIRVTPSADCHSRSPKTRKVARAAPTWTPTSLSRAPGRPGTPSPSRSRPSTSCRSRGRMRRRRSTPRARP